MRDGWTETTLGQVADYQNGYPFKPAELTGRGLSVIRIKQLLDPLAEVDRSDVEVGTRHHIRDGDLIFSWSGTLASRIWTRGPALLNQHLFRVVERPGVERGWLHLALDHAVDELMKKTHGTTMKHVTKKVLESHPVLLPPLPEQRRIVDLIGALDADISALLKEGEVVESLWQAGVAALDAQEEDRVRLDAVLERIDAGKSPAGDERIPGPGERAVLKVSAVERGRFNETEVKTVAATVSLPQSIAVRQGDLLMVRCNGVLSRVGQVCQVPRQPESLYLCDKTLRLVPRSEVLYSDYLGHVLSSEGSREQIEALTTGSHMRNISQRAIRQIEIPLLDVGQQRQVGDALSACLRQRALLNDEFQAMRALRQVLLGSLLSGEMEIPDSHDATLEAV